MQTLVQIVDQALASSVLRSRPHLACRPGCSQCCDGVFEITASDAARLREGLAAAEPARAASIRARVSGAQRLLAPFFPGDHVSGILNGSPDELELFEKWAHADACPLLDPSNQTCDLYEHRPILCRTFGPPIRNDHADPEAGIAICELCFTEACSEEIAAAEMDSSFRTREQREDEAYTAVHAQSGPTIVAFAFNQLS